MTMGFVCPACGLYTDEDLPCRCALNAEIVRLKAFFDAVSEAYGTMDSVHMQDEIGRLLYGDVDREVGK